MITKNLLKTVSLLSLLCSLGNGTSIASSEAGSVPDDIGCEETTTARPLTPHKLPAQDGSCPIMTTFEIAPSSVNRPPSAMSYSDENIENSDWFKELVADTEAKFIAILPQGQSNGDDCEGGGEPGQEGEYKARPYLRN